jgi:hypothetical protein
MPPDEAQRASPDALLALARKEGRGHLKIFLGAAPGVGKTYAMLASARSDKTGGRDVIVGLVETHGRRETQQLLEGFEVVPRRPIVYRNQIMHEFDLDARLSAGQACCWLTNMPTLTFPVAAIPSAGRTSTSCWQPGSTSGPRSTSSTSKASMTWC